MGKKLLSEGKIGDLHFASRGKRNFKGRVLIFGGSNILYLLLHQNEQKLTFSPM